MQRPQVTVSIVTHNSAKKIRRCLRSLQMQKTQGSFETLVTDNGSADKTLSVLKTFQGIKTKKLDKNYGFGHAHNLALKQARGKYFLVLNDDVVLSAGYIQKLVQQIETDPHLAGVSGILIDQRSGKKDIGLYFLTPWRKILAANSLTAPLAKWLRLQSGITCCAALFRTAHLRKEPFDPSYFMYGEDIDVCWRLHQRGFGFAENQNVWAKHERSYTFQKRLQVARNLRKNVLLNRYRSVIKNESLKHLAFWAPTYLAYEAIQFSYLVLKDPEILDLYLDALRFFWIPGIKNNSRRHARPNNRAVPNSRKILMK